MRFSPDTLKLLQSVLPETSSTMLPEEQARPETLCGGPLPKQLLASGRL
jgi:hypothetical protein